MDVGVLKKAIETYGVDMQLNVAIEEFSELTKEICKYKRGADNRSEILEEMADCYIMLEQMQLMFNLNFRAIASMMNEKVERLRTRLDGEQK